VPPEPRTTSGQAISVVPKALLPYLCCPVSRDALREEGGWLIARECGRRYRLSRTGVPLFAEQVISEEGRSQQAHYDRMAAAYIENLTYPHTREYMAYLDRAFRDAVGTSTIPAALELCCGRGEGLLLLRDQVTLGVGVDVSLTMIESAQYELPADRFFFLQGDATMLPLIDGQFDAVLMLGGIHHVRDRLQLFREVFRMLRPGGRFLWREPVSDFLLWRAIRAVIYRLSPSLDYYNEHPLIFSETLPPLQGAGLRLVDWRTYGFLGCCLLMNSDVLVFNRLFRLIPGIRAIARFMTKLDDLTTRAPGLRRAGLQVIGIAEKPAVRAGVRKASSPFRREENEPGDSPSGEGPA
jgi:SAM-dependent methyltransferase